MESQHKDIVSWSTDYGKDNGSKRNPLNETIQ